MAPRHIALALALAGLAAGCSDQSPVSPSRSATPPAPSFHNAKQRSTLLSNMAVTGTLPAGGTFSGLLTITSFAVQNGQVVANGVLTGTATPAGGVATLVTQTFSSIPVILDPPPGCQVLTLNLGALHLDLLGLVVDLAPVNLDVTAQPGPGNLVGNLLCAVTHLLDGPGLIAGVTNLLNQINTLLAGL